jgi:peptidoglycan-N-acetylmuramic acid deacetylase
MKWKTLCLVATSIIFTGNIYIKASPTNNDYYNCNDQVESSNSNLKEVDNHSSIFKYFQRIFENNENANLSTKDYGWYYKFRSSQRPPETPMETQNFPSKYDCYGLGDTSKKELYLTFDEGYENGFTAPILDVLKKHNVKAAFFVVKPYITSNPDLIKRMIEEGHLVCNHSARHPSMPSINDLEIFNKELTDVEAAFEEVTGKKMAKYFRPPMGKYSEQSLYFTQKCGYKSIFWSLAHADWDVKKQPDPEAAKKKLLGRTYNGSIILLHAVSKTNAQILDQLITEWKNQGYELKSLDELSQNKSM